MTDYPQYPNAPQGGGPNDPDDPNNPYRYGLPPAPPAYPQPSAERGPRPPQVLNAVRLMYVRALIGVISLIVLFATQNDLKKRIENDSNSNLSDSDVHNAVVLGAVIAIVILVLYVALAVQVSKGKNWARIVTWVIAGLGILGVLGGSAQPAEGLTRVIDVITLLIDVTVVVLLALKPSNEYFAKRRY